MDADLTRRLLLKLLGATAVSATSGCVSGPDPLRSTVASTLQQIRGIDVHCHTFNARDLPVVGFLRNVVLKEYIDAKIETFDPHLINPLRDYLLPRFTVLGHGVENIAPGYPEECLAIDRIMAAPECEFDEEYDFKTADQIFAKIEQMAADGDLTGAAALTSCTCPSVTPATCQLDSAASEPQLTFSAFDRSVLVPLLNTIEPVQPYIDWVRILTGYRFRIVRELSNLFVAEDLRPRLFTPATVDFDFWLAENSMPLRLQLDLTSRIARLPARDFLVNGFVGVDPLRQVVYEWANAWGAKNRPALPPLVTPMELAVDAIERLGYLGIKLYPPMGFMPIGNAAFDQDPRAFAGLAEQVLDLISAEPQPRAPAGQRNKPTKHKLALVHPIYAGAIDETVLLREYAREAKQEFLDNFKTIGARLDEALLSLYHTCICNDIPIMAHSGDSQGAKYNFDCPNDRATNAGLCAKPSLWGDVLAYKGKDGKQPFCKLRLNLGHLGGVWQLGMARKRGSPTGDEAPDVWVAAAVRLLCNRDYPNVYGDLADWGEAALTPEQAYHCDDPHRGDKAAEIVDKAFRVIGDTARDTGRVEQFKARLMYGTDWIFLGLQTGYSGFPRGLATRIQCQFGWETTRKFFRENALSFLDLRQGGCGRDRLEKFYWDQPAKLAVLRQFDIPGEV